MNSYRLRARRRQTEKLALSSLRVLLAVAFLAMGCGFLFAPGIAEDLARIKFGPEFRWLLGAAHLAGGMALLIPRMAKEASLWLGLFVAVVTFFLHAAGAGIRPAGPAVLVLVLLLFGVCLRLRHRVDLSDWHEMLGRYADQEDSRRSEDASEVPDRLGLTINHK